MTQTDQYHPTDDLLLAAGLDEPSGAAAAASHTSGCARCRDRLRRLMEDHQVIGELLSALDHPLPAREAPLVLHHSRVRRIATMAGGGLLLAMAAAATVIPGSPVRHWLTHHGDVPALDVGRQPSATPAGTNAPASGIAIPGSSSLQVDFTKPGVGAVLELVRGEGADIAFSSQGGSTAYAVTGNRVTIDNRDPADRYRIELSADVRTVHVSAAGALVLRWPEDSAHFTVSSHPLRALIPLQAGVSR